MNYSHHYTLLIERARNRILDCYSETHHVIPKCMNGTDDPDNLVELTAEEHFVAHQLLVKMHPKNWGILHASILMTTDKHGNRIHNKLYGWIKKKHSKQITQRNLGNKYAFGKKQSSDHVSKRTKHSNTFQNIEKLLRAGMNTRFILGQLLPKSEETKIQMSLAAKNRARASCIHCGKEMQASRIGVHLNMLAKAG